MFFSDLGGVMYVREPASFARCTMNAKAVVNSRELQGTPEQVNLTVGTLYDGPGRPADRALVQESSS